MVEDNGNCLLLGSLSMLQKLMYLLQGGIRKDLETQTW